MAASSSEISSCHLEESSTKCLTQTTVSNGMDFFPAATDFIFRFDVDFHQRDTSRSSRIHVYLLQSPLSRTDSVFSTRLVESHPVLFSIRGTSSNFGVYPPILSTEQAKPLEIPFLTVKCVHSPHRLVSVRAVNQRA